MKRSKPIARSSKPIPRSPIKKVGQKSHQWRNARTKLKKVFEKQGITRCEMCNAGNFLSFAHRLKRRFITTKEELETVALLCVPCHESIEYLPHSEMFDRITEIIERRNYENY